MSSFLVKACALVFFYNAPFVFSASTVTPPTSLTDLTNEITNSAPATLPFTQTILDFSNTPAIILSTAKIITTLASERISGSLNLLDIEYLVLEGVAAGARANPSEFGNLAHYFTDQNAVYNAFSKITGEVTTASQALGVLSTTSGAKTFVQNTITQDLPKLLVQMNVSSSDAAFVNTLVPLLEPVFIPMLGNLLSASYNGLNAAAAVISVNLEKQEKDVESKVASCCSSFCGLFSRTTNKK